VHGTSRWQASLVSAIKNSLPASAPPDPRVFARVVRLDFKSLEYTSGAPQSSTSLNYWPHVPPLRLLSATPKELGDAMRGYESKAAPLTSASREITRIGLKDREKHATIPHWRTRSTIDPVH